MKIGESDVTSESKLLGRAPHPIFETIDEALNHDEYGLGEQKLLELLNAQIKTNAMNALRTARTKGPTKSALRSEAMNEIVQEISNGEHQDCLGNKDALDALIARRMDKIEEQMKEAAAAAAASETVVVNDEEE